MPTGTMRIQYKHTSSPNAAKTLKNSYNDRANEYTAITVKLDKVLDLGANYPCIVNASQIQHQNISISGRKMYIYEDFYKALTDFFEAAQEQDENAALVLGYESLTAKNYNYLSEEFGAATDYLNEAGLNGLFAALSDSAFVKQIFLTSDFISGGNYSLTSIIKYGVKTVSNVVEWASDSIKFIVEDAIEDVYDNASRLVKGEITIVEYFFGTTTEVFVDVILNGALYVSCYGNIYYANIAKWSIDNTFELFSGKDVSQNIGDLVAILPEFTAFCLAEAFNAVDTAITNTVDWFKNGLINNVENALAEWAN